MPHFHTGEVLLHYELIDRAHRPVESSAAAAAQLGAPPEPPVLVLLNGLFQRSEGWDGLLPNQCCATTCAARGARRHRRGRIRRRRTPPTWGRC
jgi:hypothetical protein